MLLQQEATADNAIPLVVQTEADSRQVAATETCMSKTFGDLHVPRYLASIIR